MKITHLLLFIVLFLSGCQSAPKVASPSWIENPGEGAVGSAATHIKGRHYQEELAITRARERLASRYGVTISSVSRIEEKVRNNTAFVQSDHEIRQIMEGTEVKAQVRSTWHDKTSDTLWVWLYPSD